MQIPSGNCVIPPHTNLQKNIQMSVKMMGGGREEGDGMAWPMVSHWLEWLTRNRVCNCKASELDDLESPTRFCKVYSTPHLFILTCQPTFVRILCLFQ
jgi:hypothetical protein